MRKLTAKIVPLSTIAALLLCSPMHFDAAGQFTRDESKTYVTNTLSATITSPEGKPVEGSDVQEMTPHWQEVVRATTTDATGSFKFEPDDGRKIYWLRIYSHSFHTLWFKMKLDSKNGKALTIKLDPFD
ncbi:MAG TPA: carboxypeptidase-like regulatory domain-containing protein [Candidatus Acidoferrales bacterium]|nr:carboxypeptidase-like regulatory domain-containing protein [Candidatus Acidoferrales bacterium]